MIFMSQVLAPKPKLSNWHSGRQTSQRTFAQAPRHLSTKIGRDNLLQDDSKKATGTDFIPLQRVLSSKSCMYEAYTYTRLIADVKSDMLQYIFSDACTLNLTKVLGCCIGVLWLAHLLQANGGQMFTAKLCCKLRCTRQTNNHGHLLLSPLSQPVIAIAERPLQCSLKSIAALMAKATSIVVSSACTAWQGWTVYGIAHVVKTALAWE